MRPAAQESMSSKLNKRLYKKVAVVTGATSGVGRAIAFALAKEGTDLALLGRRTILLRSVAKECAELGSRVVTYSLDLLNETNIRNVKELVTKDFRGVDILVHSAGVIALANVAKASLIDFEVQQRCNVVAPFALTQLFLPTLIEKRGYVVFINSTAGLVGAAGVAQYCATKHALKGLADSLREEVNTNGVRVLSVYLGRTATPMQARVHEMEGRKYEPEYLIQPEQAASVVIGALTIGPQAEVTEVRIRPTMKPGAR
jgi:NADP-dependent 3-hydroxy acid dehydrogenase YdfG